ncbi:tyrosine-protein phosphatase [Proteocatella sphenisci]|uniref:tyrosine-protein phosphatase n=1 Tax=Proteocatella sphenisci TaxID=181070 RepID=UPI0004916B45|nr:CpsB/CapC family capsule biosynthesis tyrosine phosphatase [Proteocatella sphenisci]
MFDTHCHILPMVDDGSFSLEESLNMIKMAYQDGVRAMIATPHKNHPIDFRPQDSVMNSFQLLKASVLDLYPDFDLYLGAEFYITDDYIEVVKKSREELVINSTKYILIEFDREVKYERMSEVVHELKIQGLRPIIAHAEMYPDLTKKPDKACELRNQGALIQLTSASINGKRGKKIASFCETLLKKSSVDFVASDAHGDQHRKPLLGSSYQKVVELEGEKEAEKIFIKNPQMLIAGIEIYTQKLETGNKNSPSSKKKMMAMMTAIAVATLFIIGTGARISQSALMEKAEGASQKTTQQDQNEQDDQSTQSATEISEAYAVESDGAGEAAPSAQGEPGTEAAKAAIESKYYQKLKSLEGSYTGELESIVGNMRYAKNNITDEALLATTLEAYKEEIFALESQSDNNVYAALYDMQNELEEYDFEVSKVQACRDEYNDIKMKKQQEYINKLG